MSRPRRGSALVVVLAVLSVTALLGVAFATLSQVERGLSRNYLDAVRARLAARSGVEQVAEQILASCRTGEFLPPGLSSSPAFPMKGVEVELDGARSRVTGLLSTGDAGALFRVKVVDANSRLHLNDGLDSTNVTLNLARILDVLGSFVGVENAGRRLALARPAGGWATREQVAEALGPADWKRLAPHVTVHAWVDRNVVNPVPLSAEVLSVYPVPYNHQVGMYRYGGRIDGLRFAPEFAESRGVRHAVMGLDELNPQYIEVCGRAPVNVNLASREVLASLVVGLKGFYLQSRARHAPCGDVESLFKTPAWDYRPGGVAGDEVGFLYSTEAFDPAEALQVADAMIRRREAEPFRSWIDFAAFLQGGLLEVMRADDRVRIYDYRREGGPAGPNGPDDLVAVGPGSPFHRVGVLLANFDPNVRLGEIDGHPQAIDKTDLVCMSTEACFAPMGRFDVESEGIVARGGRIAARARIGATMKLYEPIRETSQAQFSRGTLGAMPSAGPRTVGGKALQLGPEPAAGAECRWGGYIQLPRLLGRRTGDEVLYGSLATGFRLEHHASGKRDPVRQNRFIQNRADPTESKAGPYGPAEGDYRIARDWDEATPPRVVRRQAPCDLRLDGPYVERDSALIYALDDTVFSERGTVMFHYKPGSVTSRPRTLMSMDWGDSNSSAGPLAVNSIWSLPMHFKLPPPLPKEGDPWGPPIFPEGKTRPGMILAGYADRGPGGGMHLRESIGIDLDEPGREEESEGAGGWIIYSWDFPARTIQLCPSADEPYEIKVDAPTLLPGQFLAAGNCLRFGEPSKTVGSGGVSRNWSADGVITEIHVWKGDRFADAMKIAGEARHYDPAKHGGDPTFVSAPLALPRSRGALPPPAGKHRAEELPPGRVSVLAIEINGGNPSSGLFDPTLVVNGRAHGSRPFVRQPREGVYYPSGLYVVNCDVDASDDVSYTLRFGRFGFLDDVTVYVSAGVEYLRYERIE